MQDRAFRLDFFIAVAALLVSALTAGTLIYQTHVIGAQYSATIWPYLSVTYSYDVDGETIDLVNDGLGPALIRSAQLSIDGKDTPAWNDYFRTLLANPLIRKFFVKALKEKAPQISAASIGPSATLRPDETLRLFELKLPGLTMPEVVKYVASHDITLRFCYCSLNGSCWDETTSTESGAAPPTPVSQCSSSASIKAYIYGQT